MGFLTRFFNWLGSVFKSGPAPVKPEIPDVSVPVVPTVPVEPSAGGLKDPAWLTWARGELGVHEIRGGENPRIIFYHAHANNKYKEDEIAWCASFCCTAFEEVGVKSTDNEMAMSFANNKNFVKIGKPVHGCVVVWEWSSGGHHVNFYDAKGEGKFPCIGGNQSDKNSGGQVSRVDYSPYVPQRVVGFYWPKDVPMDNFPTTPVPSNPSLPQPSDGPTPKGWLPEYDAYIETNASDRLMNCSVKSIIGREALNTTEKKKILRALFKAMATAESGLDPKNRYVESGLGRDMLTKEQNTSEGLFQVSYQDSMKAMYSCPFDWEKDKLLSRTSPNKTIFNGIRNLDCAMKIMTQLLKQDNSFEIAGAKYWSVLRRSRPGWKTFSAALKKEF